MTSLQTDHPVHNTAILYVDDEDMARKYFGRSAGEEYEVLTAPDADTAIDMLQDDGNRIGILVTDYRMPGRNGGELLRQTAREFPHIVRLMVTAYAERDVLLDTVNSGEVFRILEKPLDMGEVRSTLQLASRLSRERSARRQRMAAMNETLAFLAHELNTPLAAIANFAKGVQTRVAGASVSPRQQSEIGMAALAMDDNARYCLSLLDSFVKSVRETNAQATSPGGSTARQMITALLDAYPLSAAQRAAIHVDTREDFSVEALPNCVALVLSSLLGNALRAVEDGTTPEIRLTVSQEKGPHICIADNGPGIPPRVMERLLTDPVTTHADNAGQGWGMIFCKRIMQSFGGDIRVHSAAKAGTTVTLNFPAATSQRSNP